MYVHVFGGETTTTARSPRKEEEKKKSKDTVVYQRLCFPLKFNKEILWQEEEVWSITFYRG